MVKLRLQRVGRKREPAYRVVAMDSRRAAKSGRVLEVLGAHDARRGRPVLKAERVRYWLGVGAQPSVTVHNFLVDAKIIDGAKKDARPPRPPKTETVVPAESAAPAPAAA